MPSTVIQIENLSKYYRLGLIGGGTLREDMIRWLAKMRGQPDPLLMIGEEGHGNRKGGQIWALKNVNLEVKEGEILGIIGRNGAGKSTLLKILSKITAPTEGQLKIKGRIGSLLEVGTGFHPELTGRENIYLNGAILGMTHAEVSSKLEEIVEFAEMGKFIDTPVKRYSSGMTVRLAFAVAAHLEPEILVIDEVLAVGDVSFQKKCLGKMKDIAGHGRTILFVSHNMASVTHLCTRAIWMEGGSIFLDNDIESVVSEYLTSGVNTESQCVWKNGTALSGVTEFNLMSVYVKNEVDQASRLLDVRKSFWIEISYKIKEELSFCRVGFNIITSDGVIVFTSYDTDLEVFNKRRLIGEFKSRCKIPGNLLSPGMYTVSVAAGITGIKTLVNEEKVISFNIVDTGAVGSSVSTERNGIIRPQLQWEQENI